MKVIKKQNNQIIFSIEMEESLANAIRRSLNQIPIFAIDEVEISKNDSPLYDETITHRMGLIPLQMDKTLNEKEEINFKLNVKKEGIIYSEDIKGKLKIVYDRIPLTHLKKGQELEIDAVARSKKGSEHSKFSPGLMFYRNIFKIDIDKDCPKKVIDACPQKILKLENGKIIAKDTFKCDLCEACIELCQKQRKESIKITPTKELLITLESFGQMPVEDLFKKTIDCLKKEISEFSKKIDKA